MPAIQCSPQVEALRSAVTTRRSIRQFTEEPIPEDVLQDCLDMALLAPNSSNLQMWNFYRVTTPDKRAQLVKACMSQKAAKTAAELIVCTGHTRNWRRHAKEILVQWPGGNPPKVVQQYYGGLAQFMYGTVPLDMLGLGARAKKTVRDAIGLVRPMMRTPNTGTDMQLWAAKSVALACENLMLALRAYDFDSCPMEGFDEDRVRRICGYGRHEFTVMVIAAGRRHEKGIYHEQIRFDRTRFVHEI
ncbi:nitroreductase family protein [Abyssibacter sp.]|mgnify:FL=1|uniref:nitroreductase family protein n=1 Tax=Abyssibacter sp. TaxID=2320200 RepID=UPI0025BA9453|nr:nitroreductase family protein [Abyssibacter sp.]MCK5860829.1 nitroreductase family protein [Abyssibacter sp.]